MEKPANEKFIEYANANSKNKQGIFNYEMTYDIKELNMLKDSKIEFTVMKKDNLRKNVFMFNMFGVNVVSSEFIFNDTEIECSETKGSFLGLMQNNQTNIECKLVDGKNSSLSINYTEFAEKPLKEKIQISYAEPREQKINEFLSECFTYNLSAKQMEKEHVSNDSYATVITCFDKETSILTLIDATMYSKSYALNKYIQDGKLSIKLKQYNKQVSDSEFVLPIKGSIQSASCSDGTINLKLLSFSDQSHFDVEIYNDTSTYDIETKEIKRNRKLFTTKKIVNDNKFTSKNYSINLNDECISGGFEVCLEKTCKHVYCSRTLAKCFDKNKYPDTYKEFNINSYDYGDIYNYTNNYSYTYNYTYDFISDNNKKDDIYEKNKYFYDYEYPIKSMDDLDILKVYATHKDNRLDKLYIKIKAKSEEINLKNLKIDFSKESSFVPFTYGGADRSGKNTYKVTIVSDPSNSYSNTKHVIKKGSIAQLELDIYYNVIVKPNSSTHILIWYGNDFVELEKILEPEFKNTYVEWR
ncbi:MAG: hypothetical protein N3E37_04455 [Candidatus Micrarchaeota archaeon]|nr:hypothetical protein [Candidatus Micrarchaeota archaeon]